MASAALALTYPRLARWAALISFVFINEPLSFEWLPGVVFSWEPVHPPLVFAFILIIATSLVYAKGMRNSHVSMLLLFSAGLLGFLGATNAFEIFFFLELMVFPVFYMVLREDPPAAFKYFGFMQVSSVLVLAGLLGEGQIASLLLTAGFAIKMGIFPFHSWVPESHSQAPFQLSALLGASVACGAYGILIHSSSPQIILPLGILSAIYGAFGAGSVDNLEKLLAYSTISQMGYAAVALTTAPQIVVLFLIMHSLAKSSLTFSVAEIHSKAKVQKISDLGVSSKTLFIAVFLSALSIAGFPPLLGFITELGLIRSTIAYSPLVGILIAFAVFPTVLYCEKLLSVFFKHSKTRVEAALPLVLALLLVPGVIPWISS